MKSKKTTIEQIYLYWHLSYGMILVLCFFVAIFVSDLRYLVAYGLIPQGIFQIIFGFIGLLAPRSFRLKSQFMLSAWLLLSIIFLTCLAIPTLLELSTNLILILTPALPVLQFYALSSQRFKR